MIDYIFNRLLPYICFVLLLFFLNETVENVFQSYSAWILGFLLEMIQLGSKMIYNSPQNCLHGNLSYVGPETGRFTDVA